MFSNKLGVFQFEEHRNFPMLKSSDKDLFFLGKASMGIIKDLQKKKHL